MTGFLNPLLQWTIHTNYHEPTFSRYGLQPVVFKTDVRISRIWIAKHHTGIRIHCMSINTIEEYILVANELQVQNINAYFC